MEVRVPKVKVGILTCRNAKQDLYCTSSMCLHALRESICGFEAYHESGGAELLGIGTCDGCPTLAAPERIIKRVKGMVDLGASAIHLSSCMMALCPFRNKYISILQEAFPDVQIVPGTHWDPEGPEVGGKWLQSVVRPMLSEVPETLADVTVRQWPELFPKP
jgi:predicted metal-binding protein